jgi:regulator of protease activity HflC (stomatin/prohibitin superfamily)
MSGRLNLRTHPLLIILAVVVVIFLLGSIRMAREYRRAVIFLWGRLVGARGPGLFFKMPFIERAVFRGLANNHHAIGSPGDGDQ